MQKINFSFESKIKTSGKRVRTSCFSTRSNKNNIKILSKDNEFISSSFNKEGKIISESLGYFRK